jgi:tetratricopeptide (TPR) repeat protein
LVICVHGLSNPFIVNVASTVFRGDENCDTVDANLRSAVEEFNIALANYLAVRTLEEVQGIASTLATRDEQEASGMSYNSPSAVHSTFHVRYEKNPHFTGREDLLELLAQELSDEKPNRYNHRVALHGLGGVGKTQIALEYAYRHEADYAYVFWISAIDQAQLLSGFGDIAKHISCFQQTSGLSPVEIAKSVLDWLKVIKNWLLIIDNLDDITIVEGYLPAISWNGHTLITTRDKNSDGIPAEGIEVTLMSEGDSLQFFLCRVRLPDTSSPRFQDEARRIIKELGHLPLALEQAAAYIHNSRKIDEYLPTYHEQRQELLQWQPRGNYPNKFTVATTWKVSLEKLRLSCPDAITLIQCFAVINTDEILMDFLDVGKDCDYLGLRAVLGNKVRLTDALSALESFSLVGVFAGGRKVRIHRLVQAIIMDGIDPIVRSAMLASIIRIGICCFPDMSEDWSKMKVCRLYRSQVIACLSHAEGEKGSEWHILAGRLSMYLKSDGFYRDSLHWYEMTLRVRQKVLGPENRETLRVRLGVGQSTYLLGQHKQAAEMYEKMLAIQKTVLGPEDPDTLRTMYHLACSWNELGRFEKAAELHKETLDVRGRVLGSEDPDIVLTKYGLATSFRGLGQFKEAAQLYEETLKIRKKVLGSEHTDTANSMQGLATTFWNLGRSKESEELENEALEIRKKILGSQHPDTLRSMYGLATAYWGLGKFERAAQLYNKTLEIRRKVLGSDHRDTLTTMNGLAWTYDSLGQSSDAAQLFQELVDILMKLRGLQHGETLNSMEGLGLSLNGMEGLGLSLNGMEGLGLSLNSMEGLGLSLNNIGRSKEAAELLKKTSETRKRVQGPDHPETLWSTTSLAVTLTSLGELEEAQQLHEETLEKLKRVSGPEHPETLRSMYGLAESYHHLGQSQAAQQLHQETLELREKVLGPEHPDTIQSQNVTALENLPPPASRH